MSDTSMSADLVNPIEDLVVFSALETNINRSLDTRRTYRMSDTSMSADLVNPIEDLVVFSALPEPLKKNQDIVAIYSLGKDFTSSSRDWVGLYRQDWKSVYEYLTYQWAPVGSFESEHKRRRSVLFPAADIENLCEDDTKYQFLYVTPGNHVVGLSIPFGYQTDAVLSLSSSSEEACLPYPIERTVCPQFNGDLHFDVLEKNVLKQIQRKENKCEFSLSGERLLYPRFYGDLHFDVLEDKMLKQKKRGKKSSSNAMYDYQVVHRTEPYRNTRKFVPDTDAEVDEPKKRKPANGEKDFGVLEKPCFDANELKKRGRSLRKKKWLRAKKEAKKPYCFKKDFSSPVRKSARKEKVTYVVRDHETLASEFPYQPTVLDFLKIVQNNAIVKQYNEGMAQNAFQIDLPKPIYDISKKEKKAILPADVPMIEYPTRLPLLPGPESIVSSMQQNVQQCYSCGFGQKLALNLIHQCENQQNELLQLRKDNAAIKMQLEDEDRAHRIEKAVLVRYQDIRLQESVERMTSLEEGIKSLETQLFQERKEKEVPRQTHVSTQARHDKDQSVEDVCRMLYERGFTNMLHEDDVSCKTELYERLLNPHLKRIKIGEKRSIRSLSELCDNTDVNEFPWKLRKAKKIERMRMVIKRQSTTIQSLAQSVRTQRDVIARRAKEVIGLRKKLSDVESNNSTQVSKFDQLAKAFRMLLQSRGILFQKSELMNEWRLFARSLWNNPDTKEGTSALIVRKQPKPTKSLKQKSEKPQVAEAVHCRKKQKKPQRSCPVCGVTFSPNVDSHLVDEHIVYHQRFGNQKKMM